MARVLAIESSCDETAAAVVDGLRVRSNVVASQIEIHAQFGGVVPELASRHHLDAITSVIRAAIEQAGLEPTRLGQQLDALAVTDSPGLVGALLVGVQAARGLALATGLPLHGVHHMQGHLFSAFIGDDRRDPEPFAPHLALLVSGGHTELVHVRGFGDYEILGATRDDAAGEAFDKVGKLLGLSYPGGPIIDKLAAAGNPSAVAFPRAMINSNDLDFSFAGLKTAVAVHLEREGQPNSRAQLEDLCASFQAAVVDVLVAKTCTARRARGCDRVHLVGGVAANAGLRARFEQVAASEGFRLVAAPLRYCGDNAAMIAAAAAAQVEAGWTARVDVQSSLAIDEVGQEPEAAVT
ncbi:TsaD/Kae1/Qri7 protein, required for threonylcarbamoyladenosine t(6)A37 formation in tRNA [Enhygromyxa salina]|uniref:tRNA N6-adenosine threonylcarbamoyltransferase n=1 Tax=Enhygromyxa salina TaxID=215803 RepID=A0A0C1ZAA4_9BACT|nr:tRNA (adenosine(37)-N6)-threonylcarbamoyltransferase complex transferase subunit TsaD [Enhygromyxa salina]KIG14544.1 TsaD/Kae1/Qri7 protein, required for threonylcarbamoyladenosine t(6)A37 formation in tRNA [Enhygromyxa salina]